MMRCHQSRVSYHLQGTSKFAGHICALLELEIDRSVL
jgi:hypothetical protein